MTAQVEAVKWTIYISSYVWPALNSSCDHIIISGLNRCFQGFNTCIKLQGGSFFIFLHKEVQKHQHLTQLSSRQLVNRIGFCSCGYLGTPYFAMTTNCLKLSSTNQLIEIYFDSLPFMILCHITLRWAQYS